MPLRLLEYVVRICGRWAAENPGAKLPPVIPVVLHHGEDRWSATPELGSILDGSPELLAAVSPYLPLFRFVLDDLSALSLEALAARRLDGLTLLVELALWASRPFERVEQARTRMRSVRAGLASDDRTRLVLTALRAYLFGQAPEDMDVEDVRTIVLDVAGPEGREELMNLGEKLIEQGREQGREQGLEQGQRETLRAVVFDALAARGVALSGPAREQVATCTDIGLLRLWLTRAVTASSEAEVFAIEDLSRK
jgi:hypothetical protein